MLLVLILIVGRNFGTYASLVQVDINGPCQNIWITINHFQVSCEINPGTGGMSPVRITVDGLTKNFFWNIYEGIWFQWKLYMH